jgi:general stress protein 26
MSSNNTNTAEWTEKGMEKLGSLIKDIRFAMMTTQSCDYKFLHSRPMATQTTDFDGKQLWFFTRESSEKVEEIKQDVHVNVSYADAKSNTFVSVSGRAFLVKDQGKIKELWNPLLTAWFPKGLEDPEIALIRVDLDGAEYWDQPSSKMVQLYGFLKAKLTGKPFQPTESQNQKIDITSAE